jgi:hypothetical protein
MTGWLKAIAVRTDGDPASLAKIARLLHALPVTAGAFDEGRLSYGQVQTIAANVNAKTVERFAEHEADMVPLFETLTIKKTADAMHYWARHAAALADDPEPSDPMNTVNHSNLLNGTGRLDATFDAMTNALVTQALAIAETPWQKGEPIRTAGERRADAFVDICEFFLQNHQRNTGTHNVLHIHLNMSIEDLRNHTGASTNDGAGIPHHQVRRLCCDTTISRVVMNGTEIIDFGRSERLAPKALFAVLALNHRTCRYPGCDRKPSWYTPSGLNALGAIRGRVMMVHASLRAIGPVAGGAVGVIEGICAALGLDGTMLMMIAAHDGDPFNRLSTPADPENGVLAEVFRDPHALRRVPRRSSSKTSGRTSLRARRHR